MAHGRCNPAVKSWPRRHKFATFGAFVVVFVLFVRLLWGWHASRQLAAELEKVRTSGDPAAVNELSVEPLPDRENAWVLYAKATAAKKRGVYSPRSSQLEYPPYPPHGAKWEALAAASEKAHGQVFRFAREARGHRRSQFPSRLAATKYGYASEGTRARDLANTLSDGAQYAHLRGDDAEAVERLLDVLHLGRSVRQDPTLVSQLLGIGIDAVAADAAQQVVPNLRLDASAGGTPASPTQARALIAALLDEKQTHEWLVASLRRERAGLLDLLDRLSDGTWAIRPLADSTAVRWLRDYESLLSAADRADAVAGRRLMKVAEGREKQEVPFPSLLRAAQGRERTVPRYSRWFDEYNPLGFSRSIEQFHRASAERRAQAVLVACRLYRHDHGRWPADAAALVPKYLDALPVDPFRGDGKPLGYLVLRGALPEGGDRPLVFFELGDVDEGPDTEPMVGWQLERNRRPGSPRREIRQYRDVALWMPKVRRFDEYQKEAEALWKSAAEAVEGDPDEPDAPGEDAPEGNESENPPGE